MRPPTPWPGDPASFWAAADTSRALPRATPPDLASFDDFERLAAPRESAKTSAILLTVFGALFLVWAVFSFLLRPDPLEGGGAVMDVVVFLTRWHWVAVLAVAIGFLLSAPRAYRKERRDHPKEVRDLYEAVRDRGVLVEVFPASFKVLGNDGWSSAVVGIDARLDPVAAARIRHAFKAWFAHLKTDAKTADKVRSRNGSREVRSAADIFGPEAEGGYLIRYDWIAKRWLLLVPDPPNSSRSWELLFIREPKD